MEKLSEGFNAKRNRNRLTTQHRWKEKETHELLQKILLATQKSAIVFEKPTCQVFYERIAKTSPILRSLDWHVMKSKMRHVKASYKSASEWFEKGGPKQLDYYESAEEHLNKICPHYDTLKQIFDKVNDANKARIQQEIDLASAKTNISSSGFMVFDTAAIAPDASAENSEMETELNEEVHDDDNETDNESNASNEDDTTNDADTSDAQNLNFAEIKWEKQLKSLETEKEKLRIARHSAEKQKKHVRCVKEPYHRWTDIQTRNFLTAIFNTVHKDYELIEKPTSQKFYESIITSYPTLRSLNWHVMKSKMRHIKLQYLKALSWSKHMGSILIEAGKEQEAAEYIQKICPFWRILTKIFGDIDEKHFSQNSDDTTHTSYDDDVSSKDLNEIAPFSSIEIFKTEIIDGENEGLITDSNGDVSTSGIATNNMHNEAVWDGENTLASKHIEDKTADLTEAKWDKVMKLKMLQLEVDKAKIELERERARYGLETKKMELQHLLAMRKLELEHDEKIAIAKQKLEINKCEMQLKLNRRV